MGEVIAFQSAQGSKRAQTRNAGEEAQILFFTGVRYVPSPETTTQSDAPRHHDGAPRGGRRRGR